MEPCAVSIGIKTSTANVTNHGEDISFCPHTISNFPDIHDIEIYLFFELCATQTWIVKTS
jgi:hypothetical protein